MGRKKKLRGPDAEQKPPEKTAEEIEAGEKGAKGDQLPLIDVTPENIKLIAPITKAYRKALAARQLALKEEVDNKQKLLALVKEAGLQRLPDGSIRFRVNGLLIVIEPQDDKVKVKDENGDDAES
jgi:hypothetical protein